MSGLAQQREAIRPRRLSVEAARAGRHRHLQQPASRRSRDVGGIEKVGPIGEARVVRATVPAWIARTSTPVNARGHGAVHAISLLEQHGGITAVETPTPGTMADHLLIEPVLEEASEGPDLLLHHLLGVFDQ